MMGMGLKLLLMGFNGIENFFNDNFSNEQSFILFKTYINIDFL
jgi:hypothetical protein